VTEEKGGKRTFNQALVSKKKGSVGEMDCGDKDMVRHFGGGKDHILGKKGRKELGGRPK